MGAALNPIRVVLARPLGGAFTFSYDVGCILRVFIENDIVNATVGE